MKEQNQEFTSWMEEQDLAMEHFLQKYESLVWIARKNPTQILMNEIAMAHYDMVEKKWPEECKLLEGDAGDWHHGFNSGCLATIRAVEHPLGFIKGMEDFPFLDT